MEVWNKWREEKPNLRPDFTNAYLRGVYLINANLVNADLRSADFRGAHLVGAHLGGAHLRGANFRSAILKGADFRGAEMGNADFAYATAGLTSFADTDLSQVKNLETVLHLAPSTIGIDTLYKSRGNIPEAFLRGCGVPQPSIVQIPALVAALEPIQFYSCFISYSSTDQNFAERLHADLQSKGVRCWFAPEDLKIGDWFRDRIDESIRLHDKLLLILSENSVSSQWVGDEVEAAFERERMGKRTVLFPIQIDDTVTESNTGWAVAIRRTRHIGDFTRWKDHDSYLKAFDRLLRDLKAKESKA